MISRVRRRAAAQRLCLIITLALPQCLHASEAPWWVSLGVYRGAAAAQRALDALPADALPVGSQVKIVQIEKGGATYQRLVAGPFASRSAVDNALPAWRVKVQGAFPLTLPAAADVRDSTAHPTAIGDSAAMGTNAAASLETQADGVANAEAIPQDASSMAQARDDRRGADGLSLDTATERLLRDDRALQRELDRLSRGLPKGLGAEIDAARAEGVSLRELKLRSPVGPQSPTQVPDGYQLHRLHRDPSPADAMLNVPAHAPADSDWWSFLRCPT